MDWLKTNSSTNELWANRRGWDEANQTGDDGKGVALEYMVALANEIDADVWLNMPYKADDEFVRTFATFTRDNLEPGSTSTSSGPTRSGTRPAGSRPSVDHGAARAARERGRDALPVRRPRDQARLRHLVGRVRGAAARRLTRVLAGQASNPTGVTQEILKNMEGKYDAVSCTGYFGLSAAQRASFNAVDDGRPRSPPPCRPTCPARSARCGRTATSATSTSAPGAP
jgi:hypothetical protein